MFTKRRLARSLGLALSLGAMLGAPAFAMSSCFTQKEWQAAHVQALERQLQVAALECQQVPGNNFKDLYTNFIGKFGMPLKANGLVLKAHFKRVSGRSAQTELDQFITRLVNGVSERSMHSMTFCGDKASAQQFSAALALDANDMPLKSIDLVADHAIIGELCSGTVTQAAESKPRHHKHALPATISASAAATPAVKSAAAAAPAAHTASAAAPAKSPAAVTKQQAAAVQ